MILPLALTSRSINLQSWRMAFLLFFGQRFFEIALYRRRWQSISDLTLHMNEMRPDHNTGSSMPYSLGIVNFTPPWEVRIVYGLQSLSEKTSRLQNKGSTVSSFISIGLLQPTITWYKIRHAGGQAHYYSRTRTPKQRQVKLHWFRSLCFNVPVQE